MDKKVLIARIEELAFAKDIYGSVDVDDPEQIIWSKIFTLKTLLDESEHSQAEQEREKDGK